MMIPQLSSRKSFPARWGRGPALAAGTISLLLALISCRTGGRSVVLLPNVPGAKYIGSKECAQCHEEICRSFKTADHARLIAEGPNALEAGCESCHGPGSLHSESGGDVKPPYSFSSGRPQAAGSGERLAQTPPRAVATVCYQCHGEVRGQFNLPYHHPVPEDKMRCTQCHPPHKGNAYAGGGTALLSQAENCFQCHPAQRGPFTFEHEALREGCPTCHAVHGSINAKLLTVRDANLCLKCHFQRQVKGGVILIGGSDHTLRLQQGTCWSAGCHEAVHGSRVNPSLRF
ncbi:MAG: cytochrome c3 family protein [Verrucomicrobiota bacterium]|jgi:predicted CXXCH cytochrome family protein